MSCPSSVVPPPSAVENTRPTASRDGGVQLGYEGVAVVSVENLEGIDDGNGTPSRDVDVARAVNGDPAAPTVAGVDDGSKAARKVE